MRAGSSIDCGPDFRAQALAADLDRLDAVLLTHEHQDAIGGLDDLRRFNEIAGDYLPVHGLPETLEVVVRRFAYAFVPGQAHFGGIPRLRPVAIAGPFEIAGRRFVPVPVVHGELPTAGFRTGGFGYVPDVKRIERAVAGPAARPRRARPQRAARRARTRPTRPSTRPWPSSRSCGRGGPS